MNFFCCICQGISRSPIKHKECGTVFCYECTDDESFNCPNCKTGVNVTFEPLSKLENKIFRDLSIHCLFCESTGVKMENYNEHARQCTNWPAELELVKCHRDGNGKNLKVISDPPSRDHYMRPYRKVELFYNGKKIRNNRGIVGHLHYTDYVSKLYDQAAKVIDKKPDEITLNQFKHRLLDLDIKAEKAFGDTYSSVSIIDGRPYELANRRIHMTTEPIESIEPITREVTPSTSQPAEVNIMEEEWP